MNQTLRILLALLILLIPTRASATEPEGPKYWAGVQMQAALHLKKNLPIKPLAYRLSFATLGYPKAKINPKFMYTGLRVQAGKYVSITPMIGTAIGFAGDTGGLVSVWADLSVSRFTLFSEQDVIFRPSGLAFYHLSFMGVKLPKGIGLGANTEIIGFQEDKRITWLPTFGGYVSISPKPWFTVALKTFTGLDGATNVRLGAYFFIA